jgi:hypothetical protein
MGKDVNKEYREFKVYKTQYVMSYIKGKKVKEDTKERQATQEGLGYKVQLALMVK